MSRGIRLDLSTNDHVDLARMPHCHLRQVEIAHTQLRKPEFSDSFSPRRLTAIPSNSEPLMPNSARRRSPASSRGSESRMCRIGHLCSRGRLAVPQEPSHSLSGTEGAASRNHPMQAIHIKAESHYDTLILSIHIYSQNVDVMAPRGRSVTRTCLWSYLRLPSTSCSADCLSCFAGPGVPRDLMNWPW